MGRLLSQLPCWSLSADWRMWVKRLASNSICCWSSTPSGIGPPNQVASQCRKALLSVGTPPSAMLRRFTAGSPPAVPPPRRCWPVTGSTAKQHCRSGARAKGWNYPAKPPKNVAASTASRTLPLPGQHPGPRPGGGWAGPAMRLSRTPPPLPFRPWRARMQRMHSSDDIPAMA